MARPVVALLTDFGTRDHYVGTMKGAVLSVCADAVLVDISHDIPAQDIFAGACALAAAYRYFPPGTIFLVVVDPGVGTERLPIAAAAGGYYFVAPDNGVLGAVFRETPPTIVVELRERKYARSTISRTFEGRDRFAPAAAWLASGVPLRSFGPPLEKFVDLEWPVPRIDEGSIVGEVVGVDRFGNLMTNIDAAALAQLTPPYTVDVNDVTVASVVRTYAEVPRENLCALIGSSDHLEVAVNGGSASDYLRVGRGAAVVVRSSTDCL